MLKALNILGNLLVGVIFLLHPIIPHHHHDAVFCVHEHHHGEHDHLTSIFNSDLLHVEHSALHSDCEEQEEEAHCNFDFESLIQKSHMLAIFEGKQIFEFNIPQFKLAQCFTPYGFAYNSRHIHSFPTRGSPLA